MELELASLLREGTVERQLPVRAAGDHRRPPSLCGRVKDTNELQLAVRLAIVVQRGPAIAKVYPAQEPLDDPRYVRVVLQRLLLRYDIRCQEVFIHRAYLPGPWGSPGLVGSSGETGLPGSTGGTSVGGPCGSGGSVG